MDRTIDHVEVAKVLASGRTMFAYGLVPFQRPLSHPGDPSRQGAPNRDDAPSGDGKPRAHTGCQ